MTDRNDDQARAEARAAMTIPAMLSTLAPGSDVAAAPQIDSRGRTIDQLPRIDELLAEIRAEYDRAKRKHPRGMHSQHEGYAVLAEEVDELWQAVKADDTAGARAEALQVAAMALRFLADLYMRVPDGE